jgi:hypothetical protein
MSYKIYDEFQEMLGEWEKICYASNSFFEQWKEINGLKIQEMIENKQSLQKRGEELTETHSTKIDIVKEEIDKKIKSLNILVNFQINENQKEDFYNSLLSKVSTINEDKLKEIAVYRINLVENQVNSKILEDIIDFQENNPTKVLESSDHYNWEVKEFKDNSGEIHTMRRKRFEGLSSYEIAIKEGWIEGGLTSVETKELEISTQIVENIQTKIKELVKK